MSFPNPPLPEIRYGEFPFRLEYEINGERVVVEDTIICKFDGIETTVNGKYIKWKLYFKSGWESYKKTGYWGAIRVDDKNDIYFAIGGPHYYMNDNTTDINFHAFRIEKYSFGGYGTPTVKEDELLNTYGIRLISFEPSDPIVNTFK